MTEGSCFYDLYIMLATESEEQIATSRFTAKRLSSYFGQFAMKF